MPLNSALTQVIKNIFMTGSRERQETSHYDLDGSRPLLIRPTLSLGDMSAGCWRPEGGRGLSTAAAGLSALLRFG